MKNIGYMAIGFLLGALTIMFFGPSDTVVIEQPVKVPKPYIVEVPARIDTVYIEKKQIQVAHTDTTFGKYGHLKTQYFFPPINRFRFDFQPTPQPQIIIKPKFYKTWTAGVIEGAVFTGLIFYLTK